MGFQRKMLTDDIGLLPVSDHTGMMKYAGFSPFGKIIDIEVIGNIFE